MRVSTSQIYAMNTKSINISLDCYLDANYKNTTQKRINDPSDDPAGMGNVINLKGYKKALSGYYDNTKVAASLLKSADGLLGKASTQMTSVLEQAEQGATGTYSASQSRSMSKKMKAYQDALKAIANSKFGSDYIFSGEATDTTPYEYEPGVTVTGDSPAKTDFTSFVGEMKDPILVEFTSSGTIGTDAVSYRYSLDGGSSWKTGTMDGTTTPPDTKMELDGVEVEMNAGTAVTARDNNAKTGSSFVVRNSLVYKGADDAMSIKISDTSEIDVNSVGSDIFGGVDGETKKPYADPNLFESISDAVAYLWANDKEGVASTLETIREGNKNLTNQESNIGARENKVDFIQTGVSFATDMTKDAISGEEDIDSAAITIELSRASYVYQSVLKTSSEVLSLSILNYL